MSKLTVLTTEDRKKYASLYDAMFNKCDVDKGVIEYEEAYRYNRDIAKFIEFSIRVHNDKYVLHALNEYTEACAALACSCINKEAYINAIMENEYYECNKK